ncbi:Zinc finger CCHC-type protein [Dioscorea alata]|uniref:Zinc finger CCHC-type protein n=1 Tax=Dioscorea alata TaxID=55571 RepID=A0ACB7VCD1_DIOAL|nr:Zinc finger CCHC-type protein [Dioscorea alata]
MSLYVGHVPPHVRRDDIERVFQRFGRCKVQLKSGYGFVVYDAIANAEKALRMMRGKIICGEQLSLGWSNRQPKPLKRADGSIRTFEPYSRRQFKEIHDRVGPGRAQGQRDFETGPSHARAFDHSGNRSDYASDREAGNIGNNIGYIEEGKGFSSKEGLANEINPVENDRWGEPVIDPLIGHDGENHNDFDRYEPYHGLDRSYEDKTQIDSLFSSPEHAIPHEKVQRERSIEKTDMRLIKQKTQQVCYRCGVVGHIARECREGDARRERFGKYKHKREEVNSRSSAAVKRPRYNSLGKPVVTKDPSMLEKHGRDREKSQLPITKKLVSEDERSSESKENYRNKHRAESRIKKEKKDNHGTTKKALKKRRKRRSQTSSLSSDSSTDSSRSDSQSARSISDARQRSSSRSRSPAPESANSLSRLASNSSDSKSMSSTKSRPRSRVGGSPHLSISLNQESPFSMKTEPVDVPPEISPNNKFDYVANTEKSELKGSFLTSKDENALAFTDVDSKSYGHHPTPDGVAAERFEQKEWNPSIGILKDAASPGKLSENNIQGSSTRELNSCMTIPSSRVTAQELFLALRHYGLATPDEDESGISTEKYFGAARLWPWEIIYLRRMKKGAISTENYARRLEQNRQFGIVDKYIRSSSGWGECDQTNADQV